MVVMDARLPIVVGLLNEEWASRATCAHMLLTVP